MHIIEQLKEAEKSYTTKEDQEQIKQWKIQAYEAMNIESLENIEGIKILQKWLDHEKSLIVSSLVNNRKMTDLERAFAFHRTDWIDDILNFFKDRDLDDLKKQINQQL